VSGSSPSTHGKLVGLGDHAGVRDDGDVGQLVGCHELPDDRHRRPTSRPRSSPSTSRRARRWNSPSGGPCGWATTTSGPSTSCSRWQNSRTARACSPISASQGGGRSPHHRPEPGPQAPSEPSPPRQVPTAAGGPALGGYPPPGPRANWGIGTPGGLVAVTPRVF
jgi:hypothetical protein